MRVILAVLVTALGLAGPAAAAEVRVLNWQGYGTDEAFATAAFEQAHGAKVVHDYFTSEAEMLTKLRTNPGYYDVVLINSSYVPQAAAEGLIQPIDRNKIGRFPDLVSSLRDSELLNVDGQLMGIAWVWGVTSYAIDERKFKDKPTSLDELWSPTHAGRVGWRDDAVEAVQLAALALGQDMNEPDDLGAIKAKLLALKPQIRTFWSSEDEWNKALQAGEFDLATYWSGSAMRSRQVYKLPVAFIVPKEGAIGWFDGLTIAKDAPEPELAARFIDYLVSPEFYLQWDASAGAPVSANFKAVQSLPDGSPTKQQFAQPGIIEQLQFMEPLDDAKRQAYLDLWQEVKTGLAP